MKNKTSTKQETTNNILVDLTEREQWIIDELKKGTAVYIENQLLIRAFSKRFFPENKEKDEYGFTHLTNLYETKKHFQKSLRSLSKKKIIYKKALGVYGAKTEFLLGRNWVWAWLLK